MARALRGLSHQRRAEIVKELLILRESGWQVYASPLLASKFVVPLLCAIQTALLDHRHMVTRFRRAF
jgi:hypothetical protein